MCLFILDDGRKFLNTLFKLAPWSQIRSSSDSDGLIAFIREGIEYMAMVDYPYPSNFLKPLPGWPVEVRCLCFFAFSVLFADLSWKNYGSWMGNTKVFADGVPIADETDKRRKTAGDGDVQRGQPVLQLHWNDGQLLLSLYQRQLLGCRQLGARFTSRMALAGTAFLRFSSTLPPCIE